jgi:hypothetical protein
MTNITDKNSNGTRSREGAQSKIEQLPTDIKPAKRLRTSARSKSRRGNRYEVELYWTQYNRATVIIKARSLKEAEEKADEFSADEIETWEPVHGEMSVESVELAGGYENE